MDGYYLIPWDIFNAEGYDFEWVYENMRTDDVIEDELGYYVRNFPDVDNDSIPDFLQTGAGSDITVSQGESHG